MTTVAADTVAALRDRILDAGARGTPLRVVGAGTWLDAGRPVDATAESLSTRGLSGITEYVPGDLTMTARAGTTLAEIRDAAAANGQWLALDPCGSDDGTLGATVATGSAGPLRTFFGVPRDLVLGVEFVTGAGVVARGGGRVVKNVAGFDLSRLATGSWGTLGVITDVSVRLHARPEADKSLVVPVDAVGGAERARALLRRLPFTPYACEIVNETFAKMLTGADGAAALVRLGGNVEAVRAQHAALAELGDAQSIDGDVWQRLRAAEPREAIVFRMSGLPSDIDRTWRAASAIAAECPGAMLHATPARGIVRCIVPSNAESIAEVGRAFAAASVGTRIGERMPAALWAGMPAAAADRISIGIRRTFDPLGVLNPGILGVAA